MVLAKASTLPKHPRFIVLEGVNGSGKSTLLKGLQRNLESMGERVTTTREPGGTQLGAELRQILLERRPAQMSPVAELLLFASDRTQHVHEVIEPALRRGETVLCDRFLYSTEAFQGYGRGLPLETIQAINALAVGDTLPHLVLLLDLDPQIGLARAAHRQADDAFEAVEIDFHNRVRNGFLRIAERRPEPFLILDGSKSPELLLSEAMRALRGTSV